MNYVKTSLQVSRWSARIIGALFLAFVLLHIVGEGLPDLQVAHPGEWLLWLGFVQCLVGFVLLWRFELIGGVAALGGIILFYAANFFLSGKFPGGWVFPMLFVPGVLSIICWLVEHRSVPSYK